MNNKESNDLSSPTGGQGASLHYHDYLQLDKILNAQEPESLKANASAHDEMLFIIIHQAYELWFKQLHYEVGSLISIMHKPALNDNSPELQTVVHRLNRMAVILRVLVHQIDILETMTPMDFLDFRDRLRPASGFQSWQFKLLEAKLGLKFEHRHGQEYYTSQLRQSHINLIKEAERNESFLQLTNNWLERMPFFNEPRDWKNFDTDRNLAAHPTLKTFGEQLFWTEYRNRYQTSLAEADKNNLEALDEVLF
ncbi:MAG: tryptophan 2,3-dioxygenase, partial [Flavisolibacter sp.]|nr:tryptophan 2,3-dioxygenase [Flavisolibacter sp.]